MCHHISSAVYILLNQVYVGGFNHLASGVGAGLRAVFKQVVAGYTLSAPQPLALPPPTRCFSTFAQSRKARINFMPVMNTILTHSRFSGLACGRCRIKYTPGDRLTTLPDINFTTEIGCNRPGKNIVPESGCTMPEANIVCHGYQQVSPVLVCRQDNS